MGKDKTSESKHKYKKMKIKDYVETNKILKKIRVGKCSNWNELGHNALTS